MIYNQLNKPVIFHFIYNLGRGGAESMLINSVSQLKEYNNILITLEKTCDFQQRLPFSKHINLNLPSTLSIPLAVIKLKLIIKKYQPLFIHSHLPLPNIIARFATPKNVALISTIHTTTSKSIAYKKFHIKLLDKFSFLIRKSLVLGVSDNVVKDYKSFLNVKGFRGKVLHNFPGINNFHPENQLSESNQILRLVSVGTIKSNKNYQYILNAISDLNNKGVQLDIYGRGLPPPEFDKIKRKNLPVIFKGQIENVNEILNNYDVFVSTSKFEGFSLSVLEAMASRKILLLSDIPSHREQCGETAIYFSLDDIEDLKSKINYCLGNKHILKNQAELGYKRFTELFTLEAHITKLKKIYIDEILESYK